MNTGKLDALKKLGSYVEGLEPKTETDEGGMDEELKKGIEVEMEHTEDPEEAKQLAMTHLEEDPEYYSKLEHSMGGEEEGEVGEEPSGEMPTISISMLANKKNKGLKKQFGKR